MKTYGGEEVFLTSALVGGEWRLCGRAGLDEVERKKSCSYQDSNSDPSAVQPVASRYADCAIPAPG
jgi:hypothetical protein